MCLLCAYPQPKLRRALVVTNKRGTYIVQPPGLWRLNSFTGERVFSETGLPM
jgi:hypothetical protein